MKQFENAEVLYNINPFIFFCVCILSCLPVQRGLCVSGAGPVVFIRYYAIASDTCYEPGGRALRIGPRTGGLAEMFQRFTGPARAPFQPNPFHPLRELSYRQIDPFIPPKEVPCASAKQRDRQRLGGTPMASPQSHLPIHNLACLCHCRLPPWKPAVPGCAGELLAAMAAAYVMTPSVSH